MKMKDRKFTVYSTLKNGKPNVVKYKRPKGSITYVTLHDKKDYSQLSKNGSRLLLELEDYTFVASLDATNKSHYMVRIQYYDSIFELRHETFVDLMTMYLYGNYVSDEKNLLSLFDEEMKAIEFGGLHLLSIKNA